MKMYTLKECFEKTGSKFPFTVLWHDKNNSLSSDSIKLTFTSKDKNSWYCTKTIRGYNYHQGWADNKYYSIIQPIKCTCDQWEYSVLRNKECPHVEAFNKENK